MEESQGTRLEEITVMKASTFARHIREGIKNIGRNGWMTFASVSSVTVTLLLVGIFLIIMMNLNQMATNIEEDVEIRVYIDLQATEVEQLQLENRVKNLPKVESVVFSSKENELNDIISSFGEQGQAFETLREENPLNDVLVVKTKQPRDTPDVAEQIETFEGVAKINYGEETVKRLFSVVKIARNIGLALIIGLIFTAMFLIANTIRITIVARRKEIEIMKLVGATKGFIRWPFFVEGLFLGILGSIVPITLLSYGYYYLYTNVSPQLESTFITLLPVNPFAIQISIILIAIGAFIGVWGSMMSIRKFLKI
jgi:cell division transport system permease protein